jgi:hypothetical protein
LNVYESEQDDRRRSGSQLYFTMSVSIYFGQPSPASSGLRLPELMD